MASSFPPATMMKGPRASPKMVRTVAARARKGRGRKLVMVVGEEEEGAKHL